MPRRVLMALLVGALAPLAAAQEIALTAGASVLDAPSSGSQDYEALGRVLEGSVALPNRTVLTPVFSLHSVAFPLREDRDEVGGPLRHIGGALGIRAHPLRHAFVSPFARAGLGAGQRRFAPRSVRGDTSTATSAGDLSRRYGTIVVEAALGARVGPDRGLFGIGEASITAASELFNTDQHVGLRLGAGYAF